MKTYRNEHVTVEITGNVHLLTQTWHGLPSSASFREGFQMSLWLARRHHVSRWLIDLRTLRLFNPIDLQWFSQWYCLPEIATGGQPEVRIAFILNDPNQFAKAGSDRLMRLSAGQNPTLSSRYFLDADEARAWLMLP